MSRIGELIAQYCPEGVKFKRVGDIAEVGTGRSDRKDATEFGEFPFYVRSKEVFRIDEYEFDEEAILIPGEGGVGDIFHYVNGKYALHQRAYRISFRNDEILAKFAYYHFVSNFKKFIILKAVSATVISIRKPMITDFTVPVPPLEIQREIVKVLDTFTGLEAELEAELEARRRQYQYYRDALLTFGERTDADASKQASKQAKRIITLGEICNMRAGQFVSASKIKNIQDDRHAYPCYGGNGIRGFVERYSHDGAYLLIGRQGALCGNVQRARGKFYATEHAVVVTPNDDVDVDWAFHMLTLMNLNQYASKSAQPGLAVGNLEKVAIGVPPLEEQKRIASIFNKFDSLVNDLSSGLPAEIKARRQQYGYYRDLLLSFRNQESATA